MKKLILIAFAIFITTSIAFAQSVQSGIWYAGVGEGYTLDKGSGERIVTISIEFPQSFEKRPTVSVGVNILDTDKATNTRFRVQATSVSRDGFTLKITTWGDTKIYGIGGFWIAH